MYGSSIWSISVTSGIPAGLCTSFTPALLVIYEIRHVGYGRNHIHIELAIQTFLHDFHVKQAEETATETEAQRHGRFRLEGQRRIVQLQFFQRGPEIFKILGLYGIKPGKNHRLDFLETGNGFIARTLHVSNRIADFHLRCRLNTGNDIPHIPAMQFLTGDISIFSTPISSAVYSLPVLIKATSSPDLILPFTILK